MFVPVADVRFQGSLSDYGKLLLQGPFNVWMEEKKRERSVKDLRFKPSRRYIFLYEQLVLFTKRQGRDENLSYAFKNALKVCFLFSLQGIIILNLKLSEQYRFPIQNDVIPIKTLCTFFSFFYMKILSVQVDA